MPIPFLVGAAIGISALVGVENGASAISKNKQAGKLNATAQYEIEQAQERAIAHRKEANKTLEDLGKLKIEVLNGSMQSFVTAFSQLHNVEIRNSSAMENLMDCQIDKDSIAELKKLSAKAATMVSGVAGGLGAGALAAFGAYGATMTFATASTGTAIASLSGAAATNATLAFLGGGSLAAGGLGVAGGTMVLGGLVAAPALCVLGITMNASANKNLNNALSNSAEAEKTIEGMNVVCTLCSGVKQRGQMFIQLLTALQRKFIELVDSLEAVIRGSGTNYAAYSLEEQNTVMTSMAMAKTIKTVLDTPLLTEEGCVTESSAEVYEALSQKYIAPSAPKALPKIPIEELSAQYAALYFFANCDNSISQAEQELIDQYISAVVDCDALPATQRKLLAECKKVRYFYSDLEPYLDKVSVKVLTKIRSQISKIIIATNGVNSEEEDEFHEFMEYYAKRRSRE